MTVTENATTCSALATPWRCRLASARRHMLPACMPRPRPPRSSSQATVAPRVTSTPSPPSTTRLSARSALYHHMSRLMASSPSR